MKITRILRNLKNNLWVVLTALLAVMVVVTGLIYIRVIKLEEVKKEEEISQNLSKIKYDLKGIPIATDNQPLNDRRFVFAMSTGEVLERNFTEAGMSLRSIVFKANVASGANSKVEEIEVVVWLESSETPGTSVLDPMIDCLTIGDVGGWGLAGVRLDSVFEFKKVFKKGEIWKLEFLTRPTEISGSELDGAAEIARLMSKFDSEYFQRAEACFEKGFGEGCLTVLPVGLKVYSPNE